MSAAAVFVFWLLVGGLGLFFATLLYALCVSAKVRDDGEAMAAEHELILSALAKQRKPQHTTWHSVCSWCETEYATTRREFEADKGANVITHGMCMDCFGQLHGASEAIR